MLRGLVIALCSAACLPEPNFNGVVKDAAPDGDAPDGSVELCAGGVSTMIPGQMGASAEACGPNYLLRFSNQGAHLPYQLIVGGAQLLANGRTCNDERLAGVAIYPVMLVNGQPRTGVTPGTITAPLNGPVIAKLTVPWVAQYSCAAQAILRHSTTYTFFPDGHIVRWDHLGQTDAINYAGCTACSGGSMGSSFRLTSFTTLTAGDDADLTGVPIGGLVSYGQEATGQMDTCLTTLGQRVAFGWRNSLGRIRVAEDVPPRALAFVQDLVNDTMIPMNFADEVTTHMVVASTGACADLRLRARALAARPGLMIQSQPVGPANDGIYGGTNDSGDDGYMTQVGDIPLTPISAPIPSGFAVWIDFGAQAHANPTFTHSAGAQAGDWVRMQAVGATEMVFYFRDALPVGQTITIHPG